MINKLAIIGVGLIGGSLARALRACGHVREIVGFGRGVRNLKEAVDLGVIDLAVVNVEEAVHNADMVVLSVPVGSMPEIYSRLTDALMDAAVVTDVGSVKQVVIAAARKALGARFPFFVPGHPIAGTEHSGVTASAADLFAGCRVILTPEPKTDASAVARVRTMWQAVGAEVVSMTADRHDQVLAASSHLPHMLAYALVDLVVRLDDHREIFKYAAGGFRDFTRIASSDPTMWRDICLANRAALIELLRQYQGDLAVLTEAIEKENGEVLQEIFARAKHARDSLLAKKE
jgi:prephenate dehydrogenase